VSVSVDRRLVVLLTAAPAYREEWVDELCEQLGQRITLVVGSAHFSPGMVTAISQRPQLREASNVFLLRRRFLWQRRVLRAGVGADVAVLEFNPHILSNWAVLVARRLLRRRTVLWGHAWSRAGRESRSNPLRLFMCRFANAVVVYTNTGRDELAVALPSRPVYAAPNAIVRAAEMQPAETQPGAASFIYSGRFVQSKKPELALRAFAEIIERLPAKSRLIMIGDGSLRPGLEQQSRNLGIDQRVEFTGTVFEYEQLRQLYSQSIATLSPGYVGLSMTQSHAFGLPMIYSVDEPHAPEIEAAREDFNALAFETDDSAALAAAMLDVADHREHWIDRRSAISEACREQYSVEAMARGFLDAAFGL
jgi:glycosyltransferase involved in cell wall biosynthesis